MSDEILEELNSNFVKPQMEFQGQALAPYTEGSRLLLLQVRDESDSSFWFVWSFIFIHIELAKNRKNAIKLAWDKEKFKEKLFDWLDSKNEMDREIATKLVSSIMEDATKSRIEITEQNNNTIEGKA